MTEGLINVCARFIISRADPSEITRKLTELSGAGPCDIHFPSEPSEIHRIQASPAQLKSGEHQPGAV